MEDLTYLIKAQLANDLVDCFDIRYVQNSKVISLKSKEDIIDLMDIIEIIYFFSVMDYERRYRKNVRKCKSKSSTLDSSESDDEAPPGKQR